MPRPKKTITSVYDPLPSSKRKHQDTTKQKQDRIDAAEIIIPPVRDPESRAKALADPVFFVEHCCRSTLRHSIPPDLREFVHQIVTSAKTGGNVLVALPRGCGKTTLLQDTLLYCIAADIVHFPVLVAASQTAANSLVGHIWNLVETSQELYDCFPELCHPVRDLDGRHQRGAQQHIRGQRTHIRFTRQDVHFADIGNKKGVTIVARGAGASVRGLLDDNGNRPDWVICDDLQKSSTAKSVTQLNSLEKYITEDIRGLSGSDSTISVFIAATPIAPGDIVDRLSKRSDILVIRKPLIKSWPKRKDLWEEFVGLLYGDLADGTRYAHEFYVANRIMMDEGAEVIDPLAYPKDTMASALERAYYLKATMGDEAFNQEYLLQPKARAESLSLDAVEVSRRLSHVPRRTVPAECSVLLVSIDVGTATALHVSAVAYGKHQKAAVVDAYRFPEQGRLIPKGVLEAQSDVQLTKALVGVITNILVPGRYRKEGTGKTIPVSAIVIDRGFRTRVVDSVAMYFIRRGINVFPAKGWGNVNYRPGKATIGKAENVDLRDFNDGSPRWLGYNADTLKVSVMQAFKGEPLTTGSLCLWGDESAKVFPIAQEIAGETLMERIRSNYGDIFKWNASAIGAQNHYLDTIVMNLALATWLRYREPDSVGRVMSDDTRADDTSHNSAPVKPSFPSGVHQRTQFVKKRSRIIIA